MKKKKFKHQIDLAEYLGIEHTTLKSWIKQYKEFGFESLTTIQSGGNYKGIISESLHKALEVKVNGSKNPLLGYWHAVDWVKQHLSKTIHYQTMRVYLIRHFKTKKKKASQKIILQKRRTGRSALRQLRLSLNKDYKSFNLYFQDESRFGLMTHVGTALTAKGIKPIVSYQQAFKNTCLYGRFSPIDGSHFTWEIEGLDTLVFEAYLKAFSLFRPEELKVVIIDNTGFHSTKNIDIRDNIKLNRIPAYTPEVNPCEKVWQYLKERCKNRTFKNLKELKHWLHQTVKIEINNDNIINIVKSEFYTTIFKACFNLSST